MTGPLNRPRVLASADAGETQKTTARPIKGRRRARLPADHRLQPPSAPRALVTGGDPRSPNVFLSCVTDVTASTGVHIARSEDDAGRAVRDK